MALYITRGGLRDDQPKSEAPERDGHQLNLESPTPAVIDIISALQTFDGYLRPLESAQ